MKIHAVLITVLLVCLFATVSVVYASDNIDKQNQPNQQSVQNDADAQQDGHSKYVGLLEYSAVQKALGLNANQKKEIYDVNQSLNESVPNPDTFRMLPEHQREVVLHEWETKVEQLKAKLGDILTNNQVKRLKEIALQLQLKMRAGAHLAENKLSKELSLSDKQKEELSKLHDQLQKQMKEGQDALLEAGAKTGKIAEDKVQQLRDSFKQLREKTYEKAMDVLTPEQKQKLSALTGKIADIDIDQMMAEQSARVEKLTKRWLGNKNEKSEAEQNDAQSNAPSMKSSEQHPVGTQVDESHSNQ